MRNLNKWRMILAVLLAAALCLSCFAGSLAEDASSGSKAKAKWTVLVYVCGANLESEFGNASFDFAELAKLKASDDVNLVFQTGGAKAWQTEGISADCLTRFRMNGGEMADKTELPLANMGDPYTLGDFLQWGVKTYPAEWYMAVLWDHGGMIYGAESDEVFGRSIMSVPEIAQGLAQAGLRFDVIGFDACLMANYEVASTLAPYGRYLIASEEVETDRGWNLSVLGKTLLASPDADALRVGKAVCDGYLAAQEAKGEQNSSTMSVTDLDQMDKVTEAVSGMAEAMSASLQDPTTFGKLSMELSSSKRYTYPFCHDLIDLAKRAEVLDPAVTQKVIDAVSNAVVYKANGSDFGYSNGMTIFFKLNSDSATLTTYAKFCPCPAYLAFLDAAHYSWRAPAETYEKTARVPDPDFDAYKTTFELLDSDGINPLHITGGLDSITSLTYKLYRLDTKENRMYLVAQIPNLAVGENNTFTPDFDGQIVTIGGTPVYLSLIEEQPKYTLYEVPVLIEGNQMALRIAWYPPEKAEAADAQTTDQPATDAAGQTQNAKQWTGAIDKLADGRFEIMGLWDGTNHSGNQIPNRNTLQITGPTKMTFLEYEVSSDGSTLTRMMDTITYDPAHTEIGLKTIANGTYGISYQITDSLGRVSGSNLIAVNIKGGKMIKSK